MNVPRLLWEITQTNKQTNTTNKNKQTNKQTNNFNFRTCDVFRHPSSPSPSKKWGKHSSVILEIFGRRGKKNWAPPTEHPRCWGMPRPQGLMMKIKPSGLMLFGFIGFGLNPGCVFTKVSPRFGGFFSHPVEKYHRQIGRNLPQIEMKIKIFETTT